MTISRVFQHVALIAAVSVSGLALNCAQAADLTAWQSNVYYPVGSVVSYHGHVYTALVSQIDYATSGWNPSAPSLWKRLGNDSVSPDRQTEGAMKARDPAPDSEIIRASATAPAGCALEWNASNVYTTGGVASIGGVNYKARWWTRGEDPSTHNGGINQPWAVVGRCGGVSSAVEASDSNESSNSPDAGARPRAAQASAAHDRG